MSRPTKTPFPWIFSRPVTPFAWWSRSKGYIATSSRKCRRKVSPASSPSSTSGSRRFTVPSSNRNQRFTRRSSPMFGSGLGRAEQTMYRRSRRVNPCQLATRGDRAMWGSIWGQMIWGQQPAVPAVGFWGAMLLAAALGLLGVRHLRGARPRAIGLLTLVVVLLVPLTVRAVPFVFANGTVADANQVNANFAAVQGIGPTSATQLVDLVQNSQCPGNSDPQSKAL